MDQDLAKDIVEAVTKRVDERLGEAFHKFDGSLEKHTGLMLEAHEQHRRAIVQLQRAVFGSDAPPPDDDVAAATELDLSPRAEPLPKRITEGEGSVAELTGVVLNLKGEVAEVKKQNVQQLVILGTIAKAVTGVTTSPLVQKIAKAAGVVILLWLAAAQAKLQLHGVLP